VGFLWLPPGVFYIDSLLGISCVCRISTKNKDTGNGIEAEITKLGKIRGQEKKVLAVFLLVASLWVTRALWDKYLPMSTDSSIAIFGHFYFFLSPLEKKKRC